jgi:ecdysone receptor
MVIYTYITTQLIVEFSKKVPGFEAQHMNEKIKLLKGATSEIMIARTVNRYDPTIRKVRFEGEQMVGLDEFKSCLISHGTDYVEPMYEWCHRLKGDMGVDEAELVLLICISLFHPDESQLEAGRLLDTGTFKDKLMLHYANMLEAYQDSRYPNRSSQYNLIRELKVLRDIANLQNRLLHTLKRGMLPKLLGEELWADRVDQHDTKDFRHHMD